MNAPIAIVRRQSRGQALVLSALGMVLLVLMVCMTLSFGTKAKAKMELQVVADQAAYSTSVATARTYNLISMTNRVMIANMAWNITKTYSGMLRAGVAKLVTVESTVTPASPTFERSPMNEPPVPNARL